MTDLRQAAQDYFTKGWTCIPLINDVNGLPKRPFSAGWEQTPHELDVINSLPWDRALGIGIVLGPASDNLAVIDIDSVPLAAAILAKLQTRSGAKYYYVRTGRNRCHLYFREGVATSPRTMLHLGWMEQDFGAELKGKGQQVAAPPTPGYTFIGTSHEPTPTPTIEQAWRAIAATMSITGDEPTGERSHGGSGYPRAWKDTLAEGERNNAVFVEACRLAEAGMPLDAAISTMLVRVDQAYSGGVNAVEAERTVRSAYRKTHRPMKGWISA